MDLRNLTSDSLAAVRQMAASYLGDLEHTNQVTMLSLRLFDELLPLHQLEGYRTVFVGMWCIVA